MLLKSVIGFSCDQLTPYIESAGSTGITFANNGNTHPGRVQHETRNIPINSLLPRNANGTHVDDVLGIIREALEEHGYKTDIDVSTQRKIEPWMLPYAVIRKIKGGERLIVTSDDMAQLGRDWPQIVETAQAIAQRKDMARQDRPRS